MMYLKQSLNLKNIAIVFLDNKGFTLNIKIE